MDYKFGRDFGWATVIGVIAVVALACIYVYIQ
jgi:hypothetical protein